MGQGISKVGREENSLKIEDEKKFQDEIQKHKEKKERKRKQSNLSTRGHRTHEMKLCHADQETSNTNTIHENTYPTSTCSMELEHEFWSNDKDKADNDNDNEEEISVRDGLTSARTDSPQGENLDVFSSENRRRDTEWEHTALPSSNPILTQRQEDGIQRRSYYPHEREASSRSASCPDSCTTVLCQDQRLSNYGAEQSNDGWRTIKEDVNRGKPNGSAERYNLLMENERLRSKTQCCICNNRRCNIVFKPCGHLVICDNCITNTTECPVCKKKVDEAYRCG
ncbi:E3 ubiquitin-protein ligase cblA-like [Mercenaria mercenaria]|uniref:E3 ubiquitin-protein ligase cblA-like n=1 Tax=Mercenaria mercenaria TaxID=6596 RepID=UPI00234F15E2|nr:E3 ubiquitin-protein ligase cblA-like [Mercenaria mercenaria]